ncbi:hypothetical protein NC651_019625 [Populus alba x Populus x berolinensis]|nr:hypothetical protein NC651_019613 [Populus alba x Populus x berolinensis]KAJ6901890.1 hypothetical protein NC651_019625 [Populus alba x Populus x berolinensis]
MASCFHDMYTMIMIVEVMFRNANASTFTIFNVPAVLCAYLGGDLKRLRASVLLGSIVPLLALLVWDAIALGLSDQAGHVIDPV